MYIQNVLQKTTAKTFSGGFRLIVSNSLCYKNLLTDMCQNSL